MKLKNHRIQGVEFLAAHYTGKVITPEIVVLHDTAGRLTKGNSAQYLASKNPGQASAHFVLEIDGTVTQLVPTNRQANHAGASTWQGRSGCNAFSIGIEIVNPGKLTRLSGGSAVAWFGQEFGYGEYRLADVTTREHGAGAWMPYTEAQMDSLLDLLTALFGGIPTLRDITTHWYISPGRKIDTNPLFPLESVRARILGRDDPADLATEAASRPASAEEMVQIEVGYGDSLNMRRWPSFNPNILAAIPGASVVPVIRRGTFDGREWLLVRYSGQEGWVVGRYTAPLIQSERVF